MFGCSIPTNEIEDLGENQVNYVIMFQKNLEYMKAINICYEWQTAHLQA